MLLKSTGSAQNVSMVIYYIKFTFAKRRICNFCSFRHPITLLHYADKRIVNNESVHRKEQLATLNTDTVKCFDFIHVYFCEATDSMQIKRFLTQTISASFLTVGMNSSLMPKNIVSSLDRLHI